MFKKVYLLPVALLFIFTINTRSIAQKGIMINPAHYERVFVETDVLDITYLDLLEKAVFNYPNSENYFAMLNDLAYYTHTRNLPKSYKLAKKGLAQTKTAKDTLWYGRFEITLGAILLRMERLDSAESVLNDAKLNISSEDLPFLNTQLGYVYERRGELDKAVEYALESMRIANKLGDTKAIALAYSDLSGLFWKQSKFSEGLKYGLKSIDLFKEVGLNSLDYNFTLFVVGNNLHALNRPEEALLYFEDCIKMGEQYGFYNNLSDAYIFETDLYTQLKAFGKADVAGENAIKYATLLENDFMLMRSWLSVAKLQLAEKKYNKAISSLKTCLQIATENFGDGYYLNDAYESLGSAYAGAGDFKSAYKAFQTYDSLKNKLFTAEADERIALLHTQFNAAQQDAKISQQQAEISEQQNRQLLILVAVIFLVLLIILLLINYRTNTKKNKLLSKQNQEKEFLLKEIHHRVKNNLGIVSSLLALQSEQLEDNSVKDAMLESQNRVNSMSMIHQRLYQGTDLAAIEMKDYFTNLGSHVLDSFGLEGSVSLACEMNAIELDVDTAVPLGLIVNELITNSLKYAFPDNREGVIAIHLSKNESALELLIRDNGIGFDQSKPAKGTGFGTQLINLLVMQLDGIITTDSDNGTVVNLQFPYEAPINLNNN